MPKKPPRHSSAQHRPQPKKKDVLVRANTSARVVETVEEETEAQETTGTARAGAPKTKPASAAAKPAERPASTTAKRPATTTKPGAQSSRALASSQRSGRPGQRPTARPGQRLAVGRQANLVTAEHYRYVLKDLRLIGILAVVMFGIIIAMTFIVPDIHLLNY